LIEHWDGVRWTIVPSPVPAEHIEEEPEGTIRLTAVTALAPNDAWVVGSYSRLARPGTSTGQTLIQHWDGRSWTIVPSPNPSPYANRLLGVAAVSASDVWAVGTFDQENQTLIEHWNGTAWSVVSSPSPGSGDNGLIGITPISASNVWAVGFQAEGTRTLIEHWNGTAWSIVASPNPDAGSGNDGLTAVSAISATDVWAVGSSSNGKTLTEKWNGTKWTAVASPNPSQFRNLLMGVAALPGGIVWAVGARARPNAGQDQTLALETTQG